MTAIPRVVIAGTHSGAGKTSLTLGLTALLRRRGLKVQTFKVGPDYLDPTWLTLASGRPCCNLDGWMMGRDYVETSFRRATAGCDVAVIEGVMGLFDGADAVSDDGSTAQIAKWLQAPVLLTIHAHGMARSLAATAYGYAHFDPDVNVAGVLANHCGSPSHVQLLRESLHDGCGLPMPGGVMRDGIPTLASRHLGLVGARQSLIAADAVERIADALASFLDLDEILRIAHSAPSLSDDIPNVPESLPRFRLGIAHDDAFHFYYPDNLDALKRAGCELIFFSPLTDEELPENLDALYLGGGYPEEYATELSANETMRESIRRFSRLIYAECGGLVYLSEGIQTADGVRHPLLGLVPTWTRMRSGRKALGYVEVSFTRPTCWGGPGQTLRGHEYHYSELERLPVCETSYSVKRRRTGESFPEGFQQGRVLASYMHLHFASHPTAIENFIRYLEEQ